MIFQGRGPSWALPSTALASVKGGREAGKKREKRGIEGKKDLT